MTDSSPTAPSAQNAGGDPFATLHRMSTTAGVGAHDYVAVSTPSVIAGIAGAFSWLAMVSLVLLVVPLFAVVAGVIAFVQIGRSNGTQTGRLWATLGILAALVFTGVVGAREAGEARRFNESKAEIAALVEKFAAQAGKDHKAAYEMLGPGFQSRAKFGDFNDWLNMVESHPNGGKIVGVEWNGRLEAVQDSSGQSLEMAQAIFKFKLERGTQPVPAEATLVRRPGADGARGPWKIESFGGLFEKQKAPDQGGGPGGPGAPPR